jgi:hypothetical protein
VNDGGTAGPGWYADPWFTGQHRYWTGSQWTADVFPDGPSDATATPISLRPDGERPPVPPPTERSATPPPAPTFGYAAAAAAPTAFAPWEFLESTPEREPRKLSRRHINAIALITGLVVGFVVVAVVLSGRNHQSDLGAAPNPLPSVFPSAPVAPSAPVVPTPTAPVSNDPDASVLPGLVVRDGDVPDSSSVQLLDGGNLVDGQTTLDLCNGTFPSEGLRTARLQVVEYAADGTAVFSTEAVLYRTPANAAQAMSELQSVVQNCPSGSPVVSPVGEPTVTTQFGPAPDHDWPAVSGVKRQAYSFTTTDAFGISENRIAVYLQRGRVLEGLYFDKPDGAQPAVDGQRTVGGIVHVFEQRIAALPTSVTGG